MSDYLLIEDLLDDEDDAYEFEDFDDELDIEAWLEDDDAYVFGDDDDAAERRRQGKGFRSRRTRARPKQVRSGRVGRGRKLFPSKPGSSSKYVTQAQLKAGLDRVGKDIRTNGAAIKRVTTQVNKVNKDLLTSNAKQDKELTRLGREMTKQSERMKKQNEMSLLLTLLDKGPTITTEKATIVVDPTDATKNVEVVKSVDVKKENNLLPILLLGGLGGDSGGSGDNNMLLLALALSGGLG